jgi:hypothetical protein
MLSFVSFLPHFARNGWRSRFRCLWFSLITPIKTFDACKFLLNCRSRYQQLPYSCIANLAPPIPFEEIHVERITQLSDA